MREFFERIDDAVLGWCTAFAHRFQRLTGRTNFFIAKVGITLVAISYMVHVANYWFHFFSSATVSGADVVLYSFFLLGLLLDATRLDEADKSAQVAVERVRPRIVLFSTRMLRLLWLTLVVVEIIAISFSWAWLPQRNVLNDLCILATSSGMAVFYYFVAVDPLPPQKSKVRQWVEDISTAFKAATPARSQG